MTKLATVQSAAPTATCSGMSTASTSTCSACANLGTGVALVGGTTSTCLSPSQSPCCNLPVFYLDYAGTTPTKYAAIEFNVVPPAQLPQLAHTCIATMRIAINVAGGSFLCGNGGTLIHTIEAIAATWSVSATMRRRAGRDTHSRRLH